MIISKVTKKQGNLVPSASFRYKRKLWGRGWKAGLHAFYRNYIFGKTTREVKLTPSLVKLGENSFFQLAICKFAKQDKLFTTVHNN